MQERSRLIFSSSSMARHARQLLLFALILAMDFHICSGLLVHAPSRILLNSSAISVQNVFAAAQSARSNTIKPVLIISPQALSFELGDSATFKVELQNGPIEHDTTITWTYEGDQQVLSDRIQPLKIPAGFAYFSQQYTVTNNASYGRVGSVTITASETANDAVVLSLDNAFVTISVYHADWIKTISAIVGWLYFASWTLSFYPQMWENFTRKSVVGLSFDFLALNVIGFSCYTAFNAALFWAPVPRAEYRNWHPHSQIQVEPNDVAFGFHAVIITLLTICQCFIYERGGQTVSWPSWVFIAGASIGAIVQAIICATGGEQWLNLLYYLSYVKLAVSCTKYFPQMYKNFRRKSTTGWSIGNVLLDLAGGALSLVQMFMLAYNQDDWASVFYNPTKFGMGALSIVFDLIFMVQHYLLYSPRRMARRGLRPPQPTYGSYDDVGSNSRVTSPSALLAENEIPSSNGHARGDAVAPAATIPADNV